MKNRLVEKTLIVSQINNITVIATNIRLPISHNVVPLFDLIIINNIRHIIRKLIDINIKRVFLLKLSPLSHSYALKPSHIKNTIIIDEIITSVVIDIKNRI